MDTYNTDTTLISKDLNISYEQTSEFRDKDNDKENLHIQNLMEYDLIENEKNLEKIQSIRMNLNSARMSFRKKEEEVNLKAKKQSFNKRQDFSNSNKKEKKQMNNK